MRKVTLFFTLFMLVQLSFAQLKEEPKSIDIVTKKLEKVNQALSKKLDKINASLTKKLLKHYPSLKDVNIDSLLEARVPKIGDISLPTDSASNLLAKADVRNVLPDSLGNSIPDSTWLAIEDMKQQLLAQLSETPSNIELYEKVKGSVVKLEKLKGLSQQLQIPDLPNAPQLGTPDLPAMPEVPQVPNLSELLNHKEIADLKSQLTDLTSVMEEYKKEFDGWEDALLSRVTSLEEIKLLQAQKEKLASYKPLPEGYRQNLEGFQTNDFVKKQLQAKAEEIAKIGGKSLEERFTEAQTKLGEYKKKYTNLESVADAPKRPPNPLKGKRFIDRIKLDVNFQVNRQDPTSIDFGLNVAYLLSPKARTGIGTAYRVSTGERFNNIDFKNQTLSLRYFTDYVVYKSFFAQAVFEMNRTNVQAQQQDVTLGREWVQSAFIGLGRSFNISSKIMGRMSLLYNIIHDERSPYSRPLVFRIGFGLR